MKNLQSKRRLRKSLTSRPDHSLRRQMLLEQLESRTMLAADLDFGDAPDLGPGTGAGDYTTLPEYGGPSHEVSGALFMGTRPDPDSSAQANAAADGDDHGTSGEDDENGVSNPGMQLTVTATSSPVISVLVTNTTGQDALLSGWIDFNGDGVFDETERGGVDVNGDGVIDESERTGATIGFAEAMPVQLQFSEVVPVYHGATYARFRLGLADDIAAGSPTGAAGIGEVEDYPAQVTLPVRTSSPPLRWDTGITTYTRPDNDFGSSMTALGDLSGNGVVDIAVGAPGDDTGGTDRGAVHLHYRDELGAFTQVGYITSGTVGLGELVDGDRFGSSVASVGDLDNNGFIDLLVGAPGDDSGGNARGAAYVLYLGVQDGRIAVLQTTKFTSETPGVGGLSDGSGFGRVVASAGDINQDGFEDLAIVSDDGGQAVVHILFLDDDQSAIGSAVIQSGAGVIPGVADWGKKLVGLGDVNGDGIPDLAVSGQSTVDILLMTKQGGVHSSTRLGGAGYSFAFGSSLEAVGDVDGDGVPDLVVGDSSKSTLLLLSLDGSASRQISSVSGSGTVESLAVVADPTQIDGVELVELLDNGNDVELRGVTYSERILTSGGQDVVPYNTFRLSNGEDRSLASVGSLDGVGLSDLAAGIPGFDDYGLDAGAIQIALRTGFGDQQTTLIASNTGGMGPLSKYDRFGTALAEAGDLNGDGFEDLYVSAPGDSFNRGAIYSIHLNGEGLVENYQKLELVNSGIGFRELGNSIDVVGDINGDGVDDLVVSSLTADRTGNQVLFVLMDEDGAGGRLVRFQAPFNAGRRWGGEVAGVGDVNGDGIPDLAVSDPLFGRVDLVFMQQASQFIANYQSVVRLPSGDYQGFGSALASMGDMDGDGISELAVGATERAVVYFLQEDGSVERSVSFKPYVAPGSLERPVSSLAALRDSSADLSTELAVSYGDISIKQVSQSVWQETDSLHQPSRQFDNESFAKSVTSLGDLDGNGTVDFAVGSNAMDAVHVYLTGHADSLLDPLPVTRITEISVEHVTGPAATVLRGGLDQPVPLQGRLANLGDLDGDGVTDLAVGGTLVFLNRDGSSHSAVSVDVGDSVSSVTALGDLDGDGVIDLAMGTPDWNYDGGVWGGVHVLLMNADGSVKRRTVIDRETLELADRDRMKGLGWAIAGVGDINRDGVPDLVSLAPGEQYPDPSFVYVMLLDQQGGVQSSYTVESQVSSSSPEPFDAAFIPRGDIDGDGNPDLTYLDRRGWRTIFFDTDGTVREEIVKDSDADAGTALGDLNQDGVNDMLVARFGDVGTRELVVEFPRTSVSLVGDLGDAPDVDPGTAAFDYNTLRADDGPMHGVVGGLYLGESVSVDGTLDLTTAADSDDDDGLVHPERDLTVTGTPSFELLVTNETTREATLHAWLDSDLNGSFDADEYLFATVDAGTVDGTVTLVFPEIPPSVWGTTYVRFRLTTDETVSLPTGPAEDGEVEDYRVTITGSDFLGVSRIEPLGLSSAFGGRFERLGDVNGDGLDDYLIGSEIVFLDADGAAVGRTDFTIGGQATGVGDLNNDGVPDIAVGQTSLAAYKAGAVGLYMLNRDGEIIDDRLIASGLNGGPILPDRAGLGGDVRGIGDLNQDGVPDLIATNSRGSEFYVFFLDENQTVKQYVRHRGPGNRFASSVETIGDFDGDGVDDLVIGASGFHERRDGISTDWSGAFFVAPLERDGSLKSLTRTTFGDVGGTPKDFDRFGSAIANLGELYGDGTTYLAVGAIGLDSGGIDNGGVLIVPLNEDGTGQQATLIHVGNNRELFGWDLEVWPDQDGNGFPELVHAGRDLLYLTDETFDFGDAPTVIDPASNDPSHGLSSNVFLGAGVDGETRQLTNADASRDDSLGAFNDEDGLIDPTQLSNLVAGAPIIVDVLATNLSESVATVTAWIDFNGNNQFDIGERNLLVDSEGQTLATVAPDSIGTTVSLQFPAQPSVIAGTTYARFRISTDPAAAAPTGPAWDGEVEDYSTAITIINSDYGDAPDIAANTGQGDYNTLSTDSGPSHLIDPRIYLGAIPNAEIDGKQSVAANGDLDDGLVDPDADLTLFPGEQPVVRVQVTNTTDAAAQLYGWIDYNTDGVFQTDTALEESFVEVPAGYSGTVELVFPEVPAGAEGYTFARFRLSTDTAVSSPTGPAEDGEVEDYRVTILSNDYGDAPAGYNLTESDVFDPPSHQVVNGLSIGSIVDRELRGEYSDSATRDDIGGTAGVNDEDGLTSGAAFLSLTAGRAPEFEVDVTNVDGLPATLHVWLDLDFDGTFSSGEHQEFDASQSGPIVVTGFPEIGGDVTGVTYARLRLSTDQAGDDLPTGHLTDGEVEDYRVSISNKDYGDAPDIGPTPGPGNYSTIDGRGPVHTIVPGLYLGSGVDGESDSVQLLPDGRQRVSANGDDQTGSDDEDGVVDPSASLRLTKGQVPTIVVRATNNVDPEGSDALVVGWIDFNQNGVFELHERAVSEKPIVPGAIDELIVLDFDAPADLVGTTYARFRISSDADVIDPNSVVDDGEVEDYVVTVSAIDYGPPPPTGDAVVASTNIYHLTGELRYKARIGTSVATGDLNGDGHADIVTRSDLGWNSDYDVLNVGLSDAEGAITDNLQIGREIILAAGYVSLFVIRDVAIGDVNGDGTPDIVLSTTTRYGAGWWAKNQHEIQVLYLDRADDGAVNIAGRWTISSDHPNVNLGETTVDGITIKDLNRDGIPDILFGQWVDGTYPESIQALYLENPTGTPAFGALSVRQSTVVTSPYSPPAYIPDSAKLPGDFGRYIAVGDFNSDSVPDVAVSTRSGRSARIYHLEEVVGPGNQRSVRHNGESSALLNPDTLGIEGVEDTWEISALDAYDFDRDGVDELVIGSYHDFGTGAVHAVSVMPNGEVERVFTLSNASENIELAGQERFGASVAVAGGDSSGQTEILVGAPMYGGTSPSGSTVTDSGAIFSIRLAVESLPETVVGDVNSLPDIPPPSGYQIQGEATDESIDDWFVAIETLPEFPRPNETVTITLDVTAGETDLSGLDIEVPSGYQLVLDSGDETVTFTGASPALTVTSGDVVLDGNFRFVNPTDTPTIRVLGGSLKLRGVEIQESTAGDQPAIEVLGGSVDLGSAADPGDNTININGAGSVIRHVGSTSIPAVGNVFTQDGAAFLDEFALEEAIEDYFDDASRGVVQVYDDRYHAQRNLETSDFDLLRLTADLDLDDPTFEVLAGNGGTGTLLPDGNTVRFQSDNLGESSFTFAVVDNQATAAIRTVNLNVTNFAPVVDLGADRDGNEGQTFAFDGQFTDPFGDPSDTSAYTFAWLVTNSVGEVVASAETQQFDFTPADDGVYTVRYSVTDSYGVSDTDELILTAVPVADAPVVSSVEINGANLHDNTVQRSQVTSLLIQFDRPVDVAADALQVVNLDTGESLAPEQILYTPGTAESFAVRFGEGPGVISGLAGAANTLADGNYQLTINPDGVSAAGVPLEGDGPEGPFQYAFYRLAGDADGDRQVGQSDMNIVIAAQGSTPSSGNWDPNADLDGDGRVSVRDRFMVFLGLGNELLTVEQGGSVTNRFDTSGNGSVTSPDALRVINRLASAPAEGELVNAARPDQFDVNRDSRVSPIDALQIINHLAYVANLSPNASPAEGERPAIDAVIGQGDVLHGELHDVELDDETLEVLATEQQAGLF